METILTYGLVSLLCAELILILVSSRQLTVILKNEKQRSEIEQAEMDRGLLRSLVLEALVFVPASVVLVFVVLRPVFLGMQSIQSLLQNNREGALAFHGILGIVSYGFPFASLRALVTEVALRTLREFATVVLKPQPSPEPGPVSLNPAPAESAGKSEAKKGIGTTAGA